MQDDDRLSLVSPVGYSTSTCGYCTPAGSGQRSKDKSSKSYGLWANNITPETYQQMLDRGWRRSGHYIYRPDCGYEGTCCPQIAIRIPADAFRPRTDQRRAISALQRLVREPEESAEQDMLPTVPIPSKGKYSHGWEVEREWRAIEWSDSEQEQWRMDGQGDRMAMRKRLLAPIHQARSQSALEERRSGREKGGHTSQLPLLGPKRRRFETTLRVAKSTAEKYQLFRRYQMEIHGESETKVASKQGFERFLCKGPLMPFVPGAGDDAGLGRMAGQAVDVDSESPIAFDLYHMEYRYQGRLVAVGVLDILPRSISSVYLFYDPAYAFLQMGKVSAIRELALVKQIQRKKGMSAVQYYNLGLYIHSCRKMRYKAEYQPAELLDPQSCTWLPFSSIKAQLDRGVRYNFLQHSPSQPVPQRLGTQSAVEAQAGEESESDVEEEEDDDAHLPLPPPPGTMDPTQLPPDMLASCLFFARGQVDILLRTDVVKQPEQLRKVADCLAALGPLYHRFCLYL